MHHKIGEIDSSLRSSTLRGALRASVGSRSEPRRDGSVGYEFHSLLELSQADPGIDTLLVGCH